MGSIQRTGAASVLAGAMVLFALSILCFYSVHQQAGTAQIESTTTADVYESYRSRTDSSGNTQGRYICDYFFTIDGKEYRGSGCPVGGLGISVKDQLKERLGEREMIRTIVYYNTNDPSINSLDEFTASRAWEIRGGILFLSVGVLALGFSGLLAIYGNSQNSGVATISAETEQPTFMPPASNPSDRQFQDSLDRILRNEESSNRSSID